MKFRKCIRCGRAVSLFFAWLCDDCINTIKREAQQLAAEARRSEVKHCAHEFKEDRSYCASCGWRNR